MLPRHMACVCSSNRLCCSCLASDALHTSLTAGFEVWPPTAGMCWSLGSPLRVNPSLCPRHVAMFFPQWKLCFHMSLPPTAGTSVWASVLLCMPVPLESSEPTTMGQLLQCPMCLLHIPWLPVQWGGIPLSCPESSCRALPTQTVFAPIGGIAAWLSPVSHCHAWLKEPSCWVFRVISACLNDRKWNMCCFLLHLNWWEPVGLVLLMHQGIHVCHLPIRGFFTSNVWANLLITEGLHTNYCDHNLANIGFFTNGDVGDGKPSLVLRYLLKSNKIKGNKICVWICYQTFEKHKSGTLPMLLLAIFHSGASLWGRIRSGSAFFVSDINILALRTNGGLTVIWHLLDDNYCLLLLHLQSIFKYLQITESLENNFS